LRPAHPRRDRNVPPRRRPDGCVLARRRGARVTGRGLPSAGRPLVVVALAGVLAGALGVPAPTAAQVAPVDAPFERDVDLPLAEEVAHFLDVADAFDEGDDLDVDVGIVFVRRLARGRVERELGRAGRWGRVATRQRRTSTLRLEVDVGLLPDLSLRFGLPIVLSDVRELDGPGGVSPEALSARLSAPTAPDGAPVPLLSVPFRSAERSGVPSLELGLAWGPLNQARDRDLPTLVFLLTGRFAVSEPMGACEAVETIDPSRGRVVENDCREGREPGIGDGTHGLVAEVRTGWQSGQVEPFLGLRFDARWPVRSRARFQPAGDGAGYAETRPPWEVGMVAGGALVPWRDPERFQRFEVDLRGSAAVRTAGRSFTPLFDALGTSEHPGLAGGRPACAGCPEATPVEGLTDTSTHLRLGGGLHLRLQAARYVRFSVGVDGAWASTHRLTGTPACRSRGGADPGDPRGAGCPEGISNPHHRSVIDLPGSRFRLVNDLVFDLRARATARF